MFHIPAHKQTNPEALPGQIDLRDGDDIPDDDPPEGWPSEEPSYSETRERLENELEDAEWRGERE